VDNPVKWRNPLNGSLYSLSFDQFFDQRARPPRDLAWGRAVFDGGLGELNPPRKFLTPLLLFKKMQGGSTFYVPMH